MATKTELVFDYEPSDYFEAPLALPLTHGELKVDNGKAIYTLHAPIDPVLESLQQEISQEVSATFKLGQVLTHRSFKLRSPSVAQHGVKGTVSGAFSVTGVSAVGFAGQMDVVVTDSRGNVTYDSRAERIAEHNRFISSLLPKMSNNSMRAMVDSYCKAIGDPANELVHLYEIRDAACEHYRNEATARARLGVSRDDWRNLRRLANDEPLKQGRHRGKHADSLRDATAEELEQARGIARRIIEAFAATI